MYTRKVPPCKGRQAKEREKFATLHGTNVQGLMQGNFTRTKPSTLKLRTSDGYRKRYHRKEVAKSEAGSLLPSRIRIRSVMKKYLYK